MDQPLIGSDSANLSVGHVRPFHDWRVIELSVGFGPAPLIGKILSDLGCPVIKIEKPDAVSQPLHSLVSGSKSSVVIDSLSAHAQEPLRALLENASILIVDQPGWTILREAFETQTPELLFPDLTIGVCSPFGRRGPWADWIGGEEIVQAVSGIMSTTGHSQRGATRTGGQFLTHASAMFGVTAILAEMMSRSRGEPLPVPGRNIIDIAVFDAAMAFMTAALPFYDLYRVAPGGIGNRHTMSAPWNSFRCSDGWLILCAGNDSTWQRLCHAIGRPDLLRDARFDSQESRVRHVDILDAIIAEWTQGNSVAKVQRLLDANEIPNGPISKLRDVLRHPQVATRGLSIKDETGPISGGIFHRDGQPLPVQRRTWSVGDGTWDALTRSGVPLNTIRQWAGEGIIPERTP